MIGKGLDFEQELLLALTIALLFILFNLIYLLRGRGLKTWVLKVTRKILGVPKRLIKRIFAKIKLLSVGMKAKFTSQRKKDPRDETLEPTNNEDSTEMHEATEITEETNISAKPRSVSKLTSFLKRPFNWIGGIFTSLKNKLSRKETKAAVIEDVPKTEVLEDTGNLEIPQKKARLKWLKNSFSFIWKYKFIWINVIFISSLAFLIKDLVDSPWVIYKYPENKAYMNSYDEPIVVLLNRPFNQETMKPYIFPEIEGEWKAEPYHQWFPWSKRYLKFYPKESMFSQNLFVYYAGITDVFKITGEYEYGIDAFTVPVPQVETIVPAPDSIDFAVDGQISIKLDKPVGKVLEWSIESVPPVEYEVVYAQDDLISVTFPKKLAQNAVYNFSIFEQPVRYNLITGEIVEKADKELVSTFQTATVKAPLVQAIEPNGEVVLPNTPIKVIFDAPMTQDSIMPSFSINPAVEGAESWIDERTFVFTPAVPLAKATKYEFAFAPGLRSKSGGFTETEIRHGFETIGAVKVNGITPGGSGIKRNTNITVRFNQDVNHSSAQSKFAISPNVEGKFAWDGNNMIFNPNADLSFGTTYTISVATGVKSIHGLDSVQNYSHKFTTEYEQVILNVPIYRQAERYSCNLVAARMALAYRGTSISTSRALQEIGRDETPWDEANNTWGNPNDKYVGDITGQSKGYGVHWNPVSRLIRPYRNNSVKTGWNRRDMLEEIKKGNPVIIWAHNGYSSSGRNISWRTPSGTNVYAISGMHSFVVVGWKGNIDSPSHIYLNDPNRGRWMITASYFDSLWSNFNRTGIVVY